MATLPRLSHLAGLSALAAGLLLAANASCGSGKTAPPAVTGLPADAPPAVVQAYAQGTPADPSLVVADNAMGLALLGQVRQATPAANVFLSPLSLGQCLGMIYLGSAGGTQAGMAQAMHVGALTPAQVAQGNAALMANLYTADPGVRLLIANSIWAREDILPAFLGVNKTNYGATAGTLDGAPATVNAWVDTKTDWPQLTRSCRSCTWAACAYCATIRSVFRSPPPPIRIGGWGRCTDCGELRVRPRR